MLDDQQQVISLKSQASIPSESDKESEKESDNEIVRDDSTEFDRDYLSDITNKPDFELNIEKDTYNSPSYTISRLSWYFIWNYK